MGLGTKGGWSGLKRPFQRRNRVAGAIVEREKRATTEGKRNSGGRRGRRGREEGGAFRASLPVEISRKEKRIGKRQLLASYSEEEKSQAGGKRGGNQKKRGGVFCAPACMSRKELLRVKKRSPGERFLSQGRIGGSRT